MKARLWWIYLAVCAAAMTIATRVSPPTAQLIGQGISLSTVFAVAAGALLWARQRRAWFIISAGAASFVIGGVVLAQLIKGNGGVDPFPSLADAFYYAGYLGLI